MKNVIFTIFAMVFLPIYLFSQSSRSDSDLFVDQVFHLTEIMVRDVANPPAASRFYAYPLWAAYLVLEMADTSVSNLSNLFVSPPQIKKISVCKGFSKEFSAMYTLLEVGKNMMPSGHLIAEKQVALSTYFKKKRGLSKRNIQRNIEFSKAIAAQVLDYVSTDGYQRLSTYVQYSPKKRDSSWFPTPPSYMHAIEPHWNTIRPFFIPTVAQYAPEPPVAFDKTPGSPFDMLVQEVYSVSQTLTPEQKEIAGFWDCNPFTVSYSGHAALGLKKISPGGHWMGIAGIASLQAELNFIETIKMHTLLALTLHDAFISCWHEKYRSDRIRPETVINKYIDPQWRPILQTPPFPEYTSGHSVVSASAAEILTAFLGEDFGYTDTSERYFGLPDRTFTSFRSAAEEAAISRLYGGIHYMDAIQYGVDQGENIGKYVVSIWEELQ